MSRTTTIGLSRRQKVFATLEDVLGTLKFPNATTDFIRPAGDAVLNQSPDFVNSDEKDDTLDILDQFQNATPAGTFTLRMYIRPSGTVGSAPQGETLLRSLQGSLNSGTFASFSALISLTQATATLEGISGTLPQRGVITSLGEKIYYSGLIQAASSSTATLTGLTRGYASTTATAHASGATMTLACIFYQQAATSESFSLWIKTDHFIQAMSGCSINSATLEITNGGALTMTFNGNGMQMKWAGTDAIATNYATTATQITVTSAKRFCAGMYIYNETKNSAKKLISASNATSNVLRLAETIGSPAWATSDVIRGYLPDGEEIGAPIECHDSAVSLNSVAARIKSCTLNIGTPKVYVTDEVGSDYPEDYMENVRDINISPLSIYFRRADAKYFKEGYDGNEIPVVFTFGEIAGSIMDIVMKRTKLQVPEINFNPPAVELNMTAQALGTEGEDSLEIIIR